MKITTEPIRRLYPGCKIVNVEEFYDSILKKWSSVFLDGTDVRDPDLYYKYGLNFVIAKCMQEGANKIQFKVLDKKNNYCYPDFATTELNLN
jgi:hypothetical protein